MSLPRGCLTIYTLRDAIIGGSTDLSLASVILHRPRIPFETKLPTPNRDINSWALITLLPYSYIIFLLILSPSCFAACDNYLSPRFCIFILNHHFHFPASLVGGFTLSGLFLDKPWPQVSFLPPPVRAFICFVAHRVHSVFSLLVDFHRM